MSATLRCVWPMRTCGSIGRARNSATFSRSGAMVSDMRSVSSPKAVRAQLYHGGGIAVAGRPQPPESRNAERLLRDRRGDQDLQLPLRYEILRSHLELGRRDLLHARSAEAHQRIRAALVDHEPEVA